LNYLPHRVQIANGSPYTGRVAKVIQNSSTVNWIQFGVSVHPVLDSAV